MVNFNINFFAREIIHRGKIDNLCELLVYSHESDTGGNDIKKPTQILSKLFPQTSPATAEETTREQKKKQDEEDEKKERDKSWKRMKFG